MFLSKLEGAPYRLQMSQVANTRKYNRNNFEFAEHLHREIIKR